MSDILKKIYSESKIADRFYEGVTPCKLYRGLKKGSKIGLMTPTIIGFYKRNEPRPPDVLILDEGNVSPQYTEFGELITESQAKPLTREILDNADKYTVKGCRCTRGNHRGLSLFNGYNYKLPFEWYLIEENTDIPEGLAITRDAPHSNQGITHYTVAPKDDMPLSLYLVQLNALGKNALLIRNV